MKHFIHKEPICVENLTALERAALQEIYKLAHVEGEWELVHDTEGENARGVGAIACALERTGTEFYTSTGDGYICGTWGKGWVSWGIGCSGCSASCALFMDESLMAYDWSTTQPMVV